MQMGGNISSMGEHTEIINYYPILMLHCSRLPDLAKSIRTESRLESGEIAFVTTYCCGFC